MQRIKAISFDLDDTLWECEPVIHKAETSMLSYMAERCDIVRDRYTMTQFLEKKSAFMQENEHLHGDVTRMRRALLEDMLKDSDPAHLSVEDTFQHFYQVRSEVTLYKDVLVGLQRLAKHYPLAALTNGNADLSQIGIAPLFAEIHYATLECPAKPAAHMFHKTCKNLGIEPYQLLHVGDNPHTDIEGARLAGARTVWIKRFPMTWPTELATADYEIENLDQLIDLMPFAEA